MHAFQVPRRLKAIRFYLCSAHLRRLRCAKISKGDPNEGQSCSRSSALCSAIRLSSGSNWTFCKSTLTQQKIIQVTKTWNANPPPSQWYAWAPRESVHWIIPALAGLLVSWGTLTAFLTAIAYIVDVYGSANSASAVATNGLLRFLLGASFPQFIIQLYSSRIGIYWAGSIFAFLSLALVPVPWFFFYKGRELRRRSHYPTNMD